VLERMLVTSSLACTKTSSEARARTILVACSTDWERGSLRLDDLMLQRRQWLGDGSHDVVLRGVNVPRLGSGWRSSIEAIEFFRSPI
jgi:hypothetical protein